MGANSGTDQNGTSKKEAAIAAQKAKIAAAIAVFAALGNKAEIGRGIPDTRVMQGTTNEFVPDRLVVAD